MTEYIRGGLIDDHAVVRQGLRAFLAAQPDLLVVGEARSGEEAFHLCFPGAAGSVFVSRRGTLRKRASSVRS